MTEKKILKVAKLFKNIIVIIILFSVFLFWGCIGGYEKGFCSFNEFLATMVTSIIMFICSVIAFILMDRTCVFIENSIKKRKQIKRKIRNAKHIRELKAEHQRLLYTDKFHSYNI